MHIRTKILIGVALTVLFVNVFWICYQQRQEQAPDFLLENTTSGTIYDDVYFAELPYYDETSEQWIKDGKQVEDIKILLTDDDPEKLGPDSIGKYLVVRMHNDDGVTAVVNVIRELVAEGICLVGFAEDTKPSPIDGFFEASIHKIVFVKDNMGRKIECVDLVNP